MSTMNFFIQELQLLKGAFTRLLCWFIFLALLFLATPVSRIAIERMHYDLVPQGVDLVGLTPADPFIAQATVAAALALLLVLPLSLLEVWKYVAPGLYPHERRPFSASLAFGAVLFFTGAWFAYSFLIPATFAGLYAFTPPGLAAFYSLRDLVSLVCGMVVVTALLFELPVAMAVLTRLGVAQAGAWRRHGRYAIVAALVVGAVLTPDGSGISMLLLSVPIGVLYALGWAASAVVGQGRERAILASNT